MAARTTTLRRAVAIAAALVLAGTGTAQAQSVSTGSVGAFWDQARGSVDHDSPVDDQSFYAAPPTNELAALPPGTVIRERAVSYHVGGLEVPVQVHQLLYVTQDAIGAPVANVTSVIEPPGPADGNVLSYQSFYDSLDPTDNPSRIIAGDVSVGGAISTFESALIAPALLAGHRVVLTDTELQDAEFAVGPAYGRATLDGLRAARNAPSTGIGPDDQIGLFGYSGGAIASNWAAILLHDYAPELEPHVVGVAEGGVLVDPIHNLGYIGDGPVWSAVGAMALIGIARSYDVDIDQYLNDRGKAVYEDVKNLSIVEAFGRYPSLHWADVAQPQYPSPEDAPELRPIIAGINMGTAPIPSVPMLIMQGAGGQLEGTPPQIPGVGPGDGVMVSGDVRALANRYCAAGTPVDYREFGPLSHVLTAPFWAVEGTQWIEGRFHGAAPTSTCGAIPPGNDIG